MQKTRFFIAFSLFCTLVAGGFYAPATLQASCATPTNPIEAENCLAGSSGWLMNLNTMNPADDVNGQIKGYASATSVNKGGSINLHVSVNPAQNYSIEIYRLGWYGGTGGRLIQTITGKSGSKQPDCPADATTGMVACNWAVGHTLNVPSTWVTGVYVAMLIRADGYRSQIVFTVRDDSRTANFIFQYPVTTNAAYNNYPSGTNRSRSLYNFNSCDVVACAEIPALSGTGSKRAVKVSFDRPGGVELSSYRLGYEYYLLQWLEKENYDVQYVTDVDVHGNAALLLNRKGAIAAGHDEYWTKEMRDAWEAARTAGTNLAFIGANIAYWQIRLEANTAGAANRVMAGYKDIGNFETNPISNRLVNDRYSAGEVPLNSHLDPLALTDPTRNTTTFRTLAPPRPEQTLIGVQYTSFVTGTAAWEQSYVVQNASSWVYSGTGFSNGVSITHLSGYEVDRLFPATIYTQPLSTTYTTLAQSPFVNTLGASNTLTNSIANDVQQASIYRAHSNAWVFAAGTLNWSYGLARAGYTNLGIQQTMRNVLNEFLLPPINTCVNNLLLNADFESGLTNWGDNNGAQIDSGPRTGNNAVKLSGAGHYVAQNKLATPNSSYTFSGWGNRTGPSAVGQLTLLFMNGSFGELGRHSVQFTTVGDYAFAAITATAPAGAVYVYPQVYAAAASASVPLKIDDLCLTNNTLVTATPTPTSTAAATATPTATSTNTPTPTSTSTPVAVPTNTATPTHTPTPVTGPTNTPTLTATPTNTPTPTPSSTPTATPTNTPTATATPIAAVCANNLIVNAGFELGLSNWGDNVGAQANGIPHTGASAARLSGIGHYVAQSTAATAGKTYTFSTWINRVATPDEALMALIFFNSDGSQQRYDQFIQGNLNYGNYVSATLQGQAPVDALAVYAQIYSINATTGAPIYLDDICLQSN